jgi:hypothetical protein
LCCDWVSDIRWTTFYIGDRRLHERRCGGERTRSLPKPVISGQVVIY